VIIMPGMGDHEPRNPDHDALERRSRCPGIVIKIERIPHLRAFALARLVSSGISVPSLRAFMNNAR
jgi:hypothetical protein